MKRKREKHLRGRLPIDVSGNKAAERYVILSGPLTECPNPLVQNKLPPDHWEVNPLLNLINKVKHLEVPD
jgi:hypothetical protein